MTGPVSNPIESTSLTSIMNLKSCNQSHESQVPRFNLKKRTACSDPERASLTTVSSALLSGLFADAANANTQDICRVSVVDEDPRSDADNSVKKSRLSPSRSIARCGKSFKILDESLALSPERNQRSKTPNPLTEDSRSRDSLNFQLHCVSNLSSPNPYRDAADHTGVTNRTEIIFPHLPATVSNSSCGTLTRSVSDLQKSLDENTQKETYGWFVEMDEYDDKPDPYDATSTVPQSKSGDLAFMAATAPKAENHDAEVEWAKAADTVDDVLGDFF